MQQPSRIIYVDGQMLPSEARHVSALDRGFTLGDGVFETMRARDGGIFRLSDHLRRLKAGMEAIRLTRPPGEDAIRDALRTTLAASRLTDAVLRLTVTRGAGLERGVLPSASLEPTVTIAAFTFSPLPESSYARGFRVVVSSVRRNETSPTSRVKSLNYLDTILSRMEAQDAGADDAILLNSRGNVCCGTASNLLLVNSGELITPSLDTGALSGIMRQTVVDVAAEIGIPVAETTIPLSSLLNSDEAFLTNVVVGLMPIVRIDGTSLGNGGQGRVTSKLRDSLQVSWNRYLEQI